jgi:hypothetical protein
MPSLRELQVAFFSALESGVAGGTRVGPDLGAAVESRGTLDAAARIDVYAQMYWMRIADALREDFPRIATLVGDDAFQRLAREYLGATPSRHPSLRHVGGGFADFLATRPPAGLPPFVADLARLEWARLDVFDAPDADVLRIADLRRVPAEDWGDLRLRAIPALRVLDVAWPVHVVWPDDATTTALQPKATTLRVWRDEYRVFQSPMDAAESAALALVVGDATGDGAVPSGLSSDDAGPAGATFADVCAALAAATPPEEAAAHAAALLLRWVDDRLLAALAS